MGTTRAETVQAQIVIPPVASWRVLDQGTGRHRPGTFRGQPDDHLVGRRTIDPGHPAERAAAKTSGPGSNGEGGGGGTFGRRPRGFLTPLCFGGTSPQPRNALRECPVLKQRHVSACLPSAPGATRGLPAGPKSCYRNLLPHQFPKSSVTRDMPGLCPDDPFYLPS